MANASQGTLLDDCLARIQEAIARYAGRVEYGNLRSQSSDWEHADGRRISNIALVYETPGGSTDQVNVCFDHGAGRFTVLDDDLSELVTDCVETVLEKILPRVHQIPKKRREHLASEVRRRIDDGASRKAVVAQLTRVLQSEFKGGTITHLELRDVMTYAVQYAAQAQTVPTNGTSPENGAAPEETAAPGREAALSASAAARG